MTADAEVLRAAHLLLDRLVEAERTNRPPADEDLHLVEQLTAWHRGWLKGRSTRLLRRLAAEPEILLDAEPGMNGVPLNAMTAMRLLERAAGWIDQQPEVTQ